LKVTLLQTDIHWGEPERNIQEAERLMKDKAYLEAVCKNGAEKAGYIANKTLRKVYKKVGFVAKPG